MPEIHKLYRGNIHLAVMQKAGIFDDLEGSDADMLSEKIEYCCQSKSYSFVTRYDGINGDGRKKVMLNISFVNLGGNAEWETVLARHNSRLRTVNDYVNRKRCGPSFSFS